MSGTRPRAAARGERLAVRVTAGAGRTEIAGRMADGRLKVRVAAPAEDGRANRALVECLARRLGLPRGAVVLVAGHLARDKVVEVAAPAETVRRLGMEKRGTR